MASSVGPVHGGCGPGQSTAGPPVHHGPGPVRDGVEGAVATARHWHVSELTGTTSQGGGGHAYGTGAVRTACASDAVGEGRVARATRWRGCLLWRGEREGERARQGYLHACGDLASSGRHSPWRKNSGKKADGGSRRDLGESELELGLSSVLVAARVLGVRASGCCTRFIA